MKGIKQQEYHYAITNAPIPTKGAPSVDVFHSNINQDVITLAIFGVAGHCEWFNLTRGQAEQLIASLQTALQRAQTI